MEADKPGFQKLHIGCFSVLTKRELFASRAGQFLSKRV